MGWDGMGWDAMGCVGLGWSVREGVGEWREGGRSEEGGGRREKGAERWAAAGCEREKGSGIRKVETGRRDWKEE